MENEASESFVSLKEIFLRAFQLQNKQGIIKKN